jgi:integrase
LKYAKKFITDVQNSGILNIMARPKHQKGHLKEHGAQWQGHYYVYDADNKRHHKSCIIGHRTGPDKLSKGQAEDKLREIIKREARVPTSAYGKGSVEWFWIERFIPFKKWNPGYRETIESIFRIHVLPRIGKMKMANLEKHHVQLLLNAMGNYSYSTVHKIKTYLKEMLEEAIDQELIERNPVARIKGTGGKPTTKRVLTPEDIHALLAQLDSRDRLILRLFLVLGLRPGEFFALKWEDFDAPHGRLRVDEAYAGGQWKSTKTQTSNGWVAIPQDLALALQAWRNQSKSASPHIFSSRRGRPLNASKFMECHIRPAAIKAGLMKPRPQGLHKTMAWGKEQNVNYQVFRRTCATLLQATTGNIKATQSHLRHKNPGTTMEFYIEPVEEATRLAVTNLDTLLFSAVPQKVQ